MLCILSKGRAEAQGVKKPRVSQHPVRRLQGQNLDTESHFLGVWHGVFEGSVFVLFSMLDEKMTADCMVRS